MVSIIMGVYNGEKTIRQAIDSIIKQTYTDWELIICNDCSTDNTELILNDYKKSDNRIKIINNSVNSGLANSLNHCLKYANGKYIARMDCDDISVENRLEEQVKFLESNSDYDLVGTFMESFNDTGKLHVIKNKLEPTKYDLPKGAPFFHATIMVKTDSLRKLNGYKISKHTVRTEDVDLWYRFYANNFKGKNIPVPLYLVRIDDNAYKRRKLKYMLHASYIIWYGCDLVKLPKYYKIYCLKPLLSWVLSPNLKSKLRKFLLK